MTPAALARRVWPSSPRRSAAVLVVTLSFAIIFPAGTARAFDDSALIQGFLVTVFGAEVGDGDDGTASSVVKKFTGPVTYRILSTASVNHTKTLRDFLGQLADTVQNLRFVELMAPAQAQIMIYLVDRHEYVPTIRATVWDGVDTAFLEANACSAVLAARRSGIERANIYLVADEGFVGLAHCMVEEIAQSLGPANDNNLLTHSIFNDASSINVFGLFDWYILNMLYDVRIRPGMRAEEVLPILPSVIADVRRLLPHALAKSQAFARHVGR
ncbi:MAG: DUF2927 domain-containing protein [Pseudomonadota bacterium]